MAGKESRRNEKMISKKRKYWLGRIHMKWLAVTVMVLFSLVLPFLIYAWWRSG